MIKNLLWMSLLLLMLAACSSDDDGITITDKILGYWESTVESEFRSPSN